MVSVYHCLACLWCLLVSFLSLECNSPGLSVVSPGLLSSPYSAPVSGLSVVSPGLLPLPTVYQCLACLWCIRVSYLSLQCTSVWPVCGVSWSPSSPYSVPVSGLSVVSPTSPYSVPVSGLSVVSPGLPTVYQCLACLWCLLVSFLSLQCTSVWPVCGVSYLSLQCTSVWPVCGVSWSPTSPYSVPVSGLSVVSPTSPYSVPVSGLSVVSPGLLPLSTVYQCLACLWCIRVSYLSLQCTSV